MEVDRPKARSLEIGVVGVEVFQSGCVPADDLWNGGRFARHRLHIQMQTHPRRADPIEELAGLCGRGEQIGFGRGQRLQRQDRVGRFQRREEAGADFEEVVARLLRPDTRQATPLARRAKHQDPTPQIAA